LSVGSPRTASEWTLELMGDDAPATSSSRVPFVSVVMPMRNEGKLLEPCLLSLLAQSYPENQLEILVVDGCSSDGSRDVVEKLGAGSTRLLLLDNPAQHTPSGMNVGIRAARGSIIIIAGAHCVYPQRFIENCIVWLGKSGADVVGGPVKTAASSKAFGAQLACAILSSPFGVGNSRFRTSDQEGYVDTVPFGAYRREVFERVGLFNERLIRNQDNDLSARVREAGGKIYMTPALTTVYVPISNYGDLLRQALQKSQWHALTWKANRKALGFRHLCPAAILGISVFLVLLSPWNVPARAILLALGVLYLLLATWFAAHAEKRSWGVRLVMPFACVLFHFAYGLGTLFGVRRLFSATASNRAGAIIATPEQPKN